MRRPTHETGLRSAGSSAREREPEPRDGCDGAASSHPALGSLVLQWWTAGLVTRHATRGPVMPLRIFFSDRRAEMEGAIHCDIPCIFPPQTRIPSWNKQTTPSPDSRGGPGSSPLTESQQVRRAIKNEKASSHHLLSPTQAHHPAATRPPHRRTCPPPPPPSDGTGKPQSQQIATAQTTRPSWASSMYGLPHAVRRAIT